MGLISTWIGDVLGISSDERLFFSVLFNFRFYILADNVCCYFDAGSFHFQCLMTSVEAKRLPHSFCYIRSSAAIIFDSSKMNV